jgi:hypothetical protein
MISTARQAEQADDADETVNLRVMAALDELVMAI